MLRIHSVLDCFGLAVQCFETLEIIFSNGLVSHTTHFKLALNCSVFI